MSAKKEVIYIDNDDDITSVIEKIVASKAEIMALVIPKRYLTLRSSVNLRLLQKTANKHTKKIVLITTDEAILPLAGSVGIYVSESLKTRPEIPKYEPPTSSGEVESDQIDIDPTVTVEDVSIDESDDNNLQPDDNAEHHGSTASSDKSEKIKKIKNSSKIKVPNFNKFKVKTVLAVFVFFALIGGWYVAFRVMPKANLVIKARTSRVVTEAFFKLDPSLETNNVEDGIYSGVKKDISKTVTERFEATGEKDVGDKATGVMTVQNCDSSESITVTAGTIFTDNANSFEFVSGEDVVVPGGSFSGGGCDAAGEADVNVVAVESGDTRNLSPRGYSVSGFSGFVTGFGGAMTGGTSKIVKVISQNDINKAKALLADKTDDEIKAELAALFDEGSIIIDETFDIKQGDATSSAKVGDEIGEASVSAKFTYSIYAIKGDDMSQILRTEQEKQIDTNALSILDEGLSDVKVNLEKEDNGIFELRAITTGYASPEINIDQLLEEIRGEKYSVAIDIVEDKPGVGEVSLELSPFWVFNVPSPEKTTVKVEVLDIAN